MKNKTPRNLDKFDTLMENGWSLFDRLLEKGLADSKQQMKSKKKKDK